MIVDGEQQAAEKALVIIEPGTPKGFGAILRARTQLIQGGAVIFAPCPHNLQCPLEGREDWCHFAARLSRSKTHRRLKNADLGYEDEKYSYLIAVKATKRQTDARIIGKPVAHKGHVTLDLCTPEGTQRLNVSKKNKAVYLKARKAKWGDGWVEFTQHFVQ